MKCCPTACIMFGKITLVRSKKYQVQNISGKFPHRDIWKICVCNLHQHKSQFIKMKFYPKFQEQKKHGLCVLRVCLYLSVGIGSSVHQDETIPECFILLQASCLKALFLSAMESILTALNADQQQNPPAIQILTVMLFPKFFCLSLKLLQIFEIPGEIRPHLHPLADSLKEYLMRRYSVVCIIRNSMLSLL